MIRLSMHFSNPGVKKTQSLTGAAKCFTLTHSNFHLHVQWNAHNISRMRWTKNTAEYSNEASDNPLKYFCIGPNTDPWGWLGTSPVMYGDSYGVVAKFHSFCSLFIRKLLKKTKRDTNSTRLTFLFTLWYTISMLTDVCYHGYKIIFAYTDQENRAAPEFTCLVCTTVWMTAFTPTPTNQTHQIQLYIYK